MVFRLGGETTSIDGQSWRRFFVQCRSLQRCQIPTRPAQQPITKLFLSKPDYATGKKQESPMGACSKAILIVDDNKFLRSVLRDFLKGLVEREVCEAADGTEAIEKAKALKPGIIIMDLLMPGMNGIQAASVIHKDIPDARIILFSLYARSMGIVMARAVGVDVIVEKTQGAVGLMKALQPFLADDSSPLH